MTEQERQNVDAEIAHLLAQTAKLSKETRWYEVVIIAGMASALTLAAVATVKLFA